MGVLVLDLDGPVCRFRLALGPGLGADDSRAVGRHVHAALQPVPLFGRPPKRHALLHALMVAAHLEDLLVADQRDEVALVDDADVALDAAVAIGHHVRLDGVVARLRIPEDGDRALEEHTVERLGEHLVAFQVAHFPLQSRARPRQWRVCKFHAVAGMVDGQFVTLKILLVRNLR